MYNPAENLSIDIYGPFNSTKEFIKHQLEISADKNKMELDITDINDPAEYFKLGITSVPAVKINDEIMSIGNTKPKDFAEMITKKIIEKSQKREYGTIIVPVDFSHYSKTSITYAMETLGHNAQAIKLIHVNRPELKLEASPIPINEMNSIKEDLLSDMVDLAMELKKEFSQNIEIKHEIIDGLPGNVILDPSITDNNDIIIMGTRGMGGITKSLLGSVSTKVARNASCPVILVPAGNMIYDISQVLYCSAEIEVDIKAKEELLKIVNAKSAYLTILHIDDGVSYNEMDIKKAIKEQLPKNKLRVMNVVDKISSETIDNVSSDIDADLIVLSTKQRSKLGNLFHKSFTYQMALKTTKPLLIINT